MSTIDRTVADNLARVEDRIAAACEAAGRSRESVRLVGVSKYVGPAETAALVRAGCTTLGEARPQQLWAKTEAPEIAELLSEGPPLRWRLIGQLQRNKAARTIAVADAIDSVDSTRLLNTLDRLAGERDAPQTVLLEVNCSGDAEKHGFTPEETPDVVASLAGYPHLRVAGLMTMAARGSDADGARRDFALLRELRDRVATPETPLAELSMGMSGDLEAAIAEGSTLVRVGSALWEGLR